MPATDKPSGIKPFINSVMSGDIPASHNIYFDRIEFRLHSRNRFYSFFVNISTRVSKKIIRVTNCNSSSLIKKLQAYVIRNDSGRRYFNIMMERDEIFKNHPADHPITAKEVKKCILESGGVDKTKHENLNEVTVSLDDLKLPHKLQLIESIEDTVSKLTNDKKTTLNDVQHFMDKMSDSGKKALFSQKFRHGGFTIIHWVIREKPSEFNNIESLKKLIEIGEKFGLNLNMRSGCGFEGITILGEACQQRGNKEIVELLISKGADPSLEYNSVAGRDNALMTAFFREDLEVINLLLSYDVDQADEKKTKTFMYACQFASEHVVKFLIKRYGPNILLKEDANGATAVTSACMSKNTYILELLFNTHSSETKEALSKPDNNGKTALMIACENYKLDAVTLILKQTSNLFLKYTTNNGAKSNHKVDPSNNSPTEDISLDQDDLKICKQLSTVIDDKSPIYHLIAAYTFYEINERIPRPLKRDQRIATIINCYGKHLDFDEDHIDILREKATHISKLIKTKVAVQRLQAVKLDDAKDEAAILHIS